MKASPNHIPSLLSSLLFIVAGVLLLGIALLMGTAVLVAVLTGSTVQPEQPIFLISFGFEALLLFAAAFFAFQKFLKKPAADRLTTLSLNGWQIVGLVVVGALALLTGYLIADMELLNWLFLPLLTIPAIVLPLGALLALGVRKLPLAKRWQTWTVLGLAMTLGPVLLFILEIMLAIFIFVAGAAYVSTQPDLVLELQLLSEKLLVLAPQSDPEAIVELLSPLLVRPAVMATALLYIAVLVPAIEEVLKPIGVWLFASKLASPAQGFALGALSGAGYALIETIGVSGQQSTEWATLLSTRIGTGLLHITTSALVGAAIVLAWRERRYVRLLGTYLAAVFLHGLWNALAMLFTFSALSEFMTEPASMGQLQFPAIIAMSILAGLLFVILLLANRRLRPLDSPPGLDLDPLPEETAPDRTA